MLTKKQVQEKKKRTKPSLVMPIFNTVCSVVFLAIIIAFKIMDNEALSWPLFIFFVVIVTLFCASSWVSSFFAKKQKRKMYVDFEKESALIVEYMEHRKSFKVFENNDKVKLKLTATKTDEELNDFSYNNEKNSFGFLDSSRAVISIGIGFLALEIDPNTSEIIAIKGLMPRSIWIKKNFEMPEAIKSRVTASALINIQSKTYIQTNKQDDTYYCEKTNTLCVGDYKNAKAYDNVEIFNGVVLSLDNQTLKAVWIKLQ